MIAFIALSLMASTATTLVDRCLDSGEAKEGVVPAILDCIRADISRGDIALNRAYRAKLASLSPTRRAALKQSERKWLVAKDRDCLAESRNDTSTDGNIATHWCLDRQIAERTAFIRRFK